MIIYKNTLSELVKGDFTSKTFQLERRSFSYYAKSIIRLDSHDIICEQEIYSFLPDNYKSLIDESFKSCSFVDMINKITEYLTSNGTKVRTIEKKRKINYEKTNW